MGIEHPRGPIDRDAVDLTRARGVIVDPEPDRPRRRRIHGRRRRIVRRTIRVVAAVEELVGLVRKHRASDDDHPARNAQAAGDRADDPASAAAGGETATEEHEGDQEDRLHALRGAPPSLPSLVGILHKHLTFLLKN